MSALQSIARAAVGKDRPNKDVDDWCNALWGQSSSPGVNSSPKRRKREEAWAERLAKADGRVKGVKVRRVEVSERDDVVDEDENTPTKKTSSGPKSPSPTKLRALGSMTNVFAGSGSPSRSVHFPPSGSRKVRQVKPVQSAIGMQSPPPSLPVKDSASSLPQSIHPPKPKSAPTLLSGPQNPICPPKHDRALVTPPTPPFTLQPTPTSTFTPGPTAPKTRYADTALGRFLEKAAIWLVRPPSAPKPAWRVGSHHIIPLGHQVNSLDALLMACRWNDGAANSPEADKKDVCEWADRGVVFVDDTEDASWRDTVLKRLLDRRSALMKDGTNEGRRKPVFVMSMKSLSLEEVMREGSVEQRAICRLG